MSHQLVIVLDFGGQYNQLIARRVRECGVYCEVKPYTTPLEELKAMAPIGFIFTGGPNSVYLEDAPHVDPAIFELGVPVLGICYGCQLMAHTLGGRVTAAQDDSAREYGKTETFYNTSCPLFRGLPESGVSWMSHGDYMARVPEGFARPGTRPVSKIGRDYTCAASGQLRTRFQAFVESLEIKRIQAAEQKEGA